MVALKLSSSDSNRKWYNISEFCAFRTGWLTQWALAQSWTSLMVSRPYCVSKFLEFLWESSMFKRSFHPKLLAWLDTLFQCEKPCCNLKVHYLVLVPVRTQCYRGSLSYSLGWRLSLRLHTLPLSFSDLRGDLVSTMIENLYR